MYTRDVGRSILVEKIINNTMENKRIDWGQATVEGLRRLRPKVAVDLTKLDGKAFTLLRAYSEAGRKQGVSGEILNDVMNEAISGDYDHLLQVLLANTH